MFTLNVCSGRIAEKHSPYSPTKKHCRTALNSGHRLKKNPPVWLSHWSSVGVCKGFFDCQHERLTLDSSKPKASGIAVVFKELASVICANQISCVSHNGNRVRSLREKGVWTPPARRIVPQPELNQLQELRSTRWTSWARRQGMINDYTMIMQWSYNDLGFGLWWVVMKEPPCQLYSLLSSDHVMPCKPLRISLSHSPLWTCRRVVLLTGQMAGFCSWCQLCVSARSRSLSLSDFLFLSSIDSRCPRLKRTSARYNRTSLRSWGCLFARRTWGTNMPDILRHFRYCVWTFLWFCYTLVLLIKLFWRKGWVLNSLFMPSKQELVRVACEILWGLWGLWRFRFLSHFLLHRRTYLRVLHQRAVDRRRARWCSKDWLVHTHGKIH